MKRCQPLVGGALLPVGRVSLFRIFSRIPATMSAKLKATGNSLLLVRYACRMHPRFRCKKMLDHLEESSKAKQAMYVRLHCVSLRAGHLVTKRKVLR